MRIGVDAHADDAQRNGLFEKQVISLGISDPTFLKGNRHHHVVRSLLIAFHRRFEEFAQIRFTQSILRFFLRLPTDPAAKTIARLLLIVRQPLR